MLLFSYSAGTEHVDGEDAAEHVQHSSQSDQSSEEGPADGDKVDVPHAGIHQTDHAVHDGALEHGVEQTDDGVQNNQQQEEQESFAERIGVLTA